MKEVTKQEADEAKVIAGHLGKLYRSYKKEIEIFEYQNCVAENYRTYKAESEFIYLIDVNLRHCSKDTRCIITHDYLMDSEQDWYRDFYSKSTYYRLKRNAVKEFVDCLNN